MNVNNVQRFRDILNSTESLMKEYHKEKTYEALVKIIQKVASNSISLMVCGEFKRGKSTFINAFLDEEICPTDGHIATAAVSVIKYGPIKKVVRYYSDEGELKKEEIDYSKIALYAKGSSMDIDNTMMLIIETPSEKLKDGLTIMDTPGVGGLDPRHLFLTLYALPKADAALFMLDAGEPMSSSEISFLKDKILSANKNCKVLINRTAQEVQENIPILVNDVKSKISKNCNTEIEVIPFDALLWQNYNETQEKDFMIASNCEEVLRAIDRIRSEFQTSQLQILKSLTLSVLDEIRGIIVEELESIEDNSLERKNRIQQRALLLRQLLNSLQSSNSDLRLSLNEHIQKSKRNVFHCLSNSSILLSSDKLDNILSDPRATQNDNGAWVLDQLNAEVQALSETLDIEIENGFESVLNELSEIIQEQFDVEESVFDDSVSADLTPQIKSISDKISDVTRQTLPIMGVSMITGYAVSLSGTLVAGVGAAMGVSLGLGALLSTLAAPVGIAAGIWYICKSIRKSSTQERINEIRRKVTPRINAIVNNLRQHVDERFTAFENGLTNCLKDTVESTSKELADLQLQIQKCDADHQQVEEKKKALGKEIAFIDNCKGHTNPLLTNPFQQ